MTSPSWTLVRVFGKYTYRDGSSARGSITFSSTPRIKVDGELNLPKPIVANLRKDGSFETYLPATDDPDLSHVDWMYTVTELFNGGRAPYMITVPHTAPFVDLVSLVPLTVDPSTPQEDLVAALAQVQAQVSNAAVSATAAAGSATAAGQSATTATGAVTAAQSAKTAAETAASEADASSQTAAGHATVAANSAAAANVSAGDVAVIVNQFGNMATVIGAVEAARDTAQGYATTATTKAGEAATSASTTTAARTAAETARDTATGAATTATTKAGEAATSATNASTSAGTATTQATSAGNSATAAATSATNAGNSASSALSSASAASGSATAAATSATNASNSAGTASTHATTATTAKTQAEAARDKAQLWADAPQGTEVEAGGYSAKHWALQAQASSTGTLVYMGAWAASSGSYPPLPNKGHFYKVSAAGSLGAVDYAIGDQIIYNGTDWDKIDNTEQVTSVAGRTGAIELTKTDVGLGLVDNTSDAAKPISSATQTALNAKAPLTGAGASGTWDINITGNATTATSAATLTSARTIALSGKATGTATSFNGSANITIPITAVSIAGTEITSGTIPVARSWALTGDVTKSAGSGATTIAAGAVTLAKMANVATGTVFYRKTAATGVPEVQTLATLKTDLGLTGTNSGDQTTITGNAGTATTLQTARTLTIGTTGKTFNGSANVSWSLAEIGAAASIHTHSLLDQGNGFVSWTGEVTVTPSTGVALLDSAGVALSPTKTYKVAACNLDSSAQRGAVVLFVGDGSSFTRQVVYEQGTTSSNVQIYLDAGVPSVSVYGGSGTYRIPYRIEEVPNFGQALSEFGILQRLLDAPSDGKTYGRKDAAWVEAGGATTVEITGASATLALTHANRFVRFNNATAQTITIPPQSSVAWPADTQIEGVQWGAGAVTFVAGSGVTLRKRSNRTATTAGQYAAWGLKRTGLNEWLLFGELGSA